MRLLNVESRQLEEYFAGIPPYAILSHTWEDEEVTFQDLADPSHVRKKGYDKIDMTCRLAGKQGLKYAWIDTCCIDKTSSAELSEAINSMFRWYHNSVICYAYLSDVSSSTGQQEAIETNSSFRRSRWFTRGWTLQELLAPREVLFYGCLWNELGKRNDMRDLISDITAIPETCLGGYHPETEIALDYNLAQRMAWASGRYTTRVEDAAYCLLGIFNVHMPLLYGEGEEAFLRLQRQILTVHADESILAWNLDVGLKADQLYQQVAAIPQRVHKPRPAFALSPQEFAPWQVLQQHRFSLYPSQLWSPGNALQLTNRGLRMTLPITGVHGMVFAVLNCSLNRMVDSMLVIPLISVGPPDTPNVYQRCAALPAMIGTYSILSLTEITTIFMQVNVRAFEAKRSILAGRPQLKDGAVVVVIDADTPVVLASVRNATWDGGQVVHLPRSVCTSVLHFKVTHPKGGSFLVDRRVSSTGGRAELEYTFGLQGDEEENSQWHRLADCVRRRLVVKGITYSVAIKEQRFLGFLVTVVNILADDPAMVS